MNFRMVWICRNGAPAAIGLCPLPQHSPRGRGSHMNFRMVWICGSRAPPTAISLRGPL